MVELCVHCGAEVVTRHGYSHDELYNLNGTLHREQCEICGVFISAVKFTAHINGHESALVGKVPELRTGAVTRGSLFRRFIRRLTH